jgi:butyrate kinase
MNTIIYFVNQFVGYDLAPSRCRSWAVNHDVLMRRVARKVRDKRVLRLIGKYLRTGVMVQGRLQETRLGVPQGGPLSPLLANIIPSPNTSAAG